MRNTFLRILAAALIGMLACAAAFAQGPVVTANIPFDFVIGKQVMTAGEYRIATPKPNLLSIKKADGSEFSFALVQPLTASTYVNPKLVFHKYADGLYLVQVWNGSPDGNELQVSKTAEPVVAQKGAPSEIVIKAKSQ